MLRPYVSRSCGMCGTWCASGRRLSLLARRACCRGIRLWATLVATTACCATLPPSSATPSLSKWVCFCGGGGGVLGVGGGYVQRRASARVHAGLFVHASMRMHAASMITEGVCVCVRVCRRVYVRVSGTMHGGSAIALASGSKTNSVVTYNIVDDFSPNAAACGMTGLYFTTSPCSLLRLFPLYYYLIFTSPRSSRLLPECCCVWSVYS